MRLPIVEIYTNLENFFLNITNRRLEECLIFIEMEVSKERGRLCAVEEHLVDGGRIELQVNGAFPDGGQMFDERIGQRRLERADIEARNLAREIALRVENELKYPGEIRVNVIRELRVLEYAR